MSPRTPLLATLLAAALSAGAAAACDSATTDGGDYGALASASVRTCAGDPVDIATLAAQHDVTFITFAAAWCTACQEEAPRINSELFDHFAQTGGDVQVLQILVENFRGEPPPQALCSSWSTDLQAKFTVLVDVDQVMVPQHFDGQVNQLPLHLIVTRDGTIVFRLLDALPANIQQVVADWLPAS